MESTGRIIIPRFNVLYCPTFQHIMVLEHAKYLIHDDLPNPTVRKNRTRSKMSINQVRKSFECYHVKVERYTVPSRPLCYVIIASFIRRNAGGQLKSRVSDGESEGRSRGRAWREGRTLGASSGLSHGLFGRPFRARRWHKPHNPVCRPPPPSFHYPLTYRPITTLSICLI